MKGGALPLGVVAILRVFLPRDWCADIVRDLEEAYAARRAEGEWAARFWVWFHVAMFSVRFLPARVHEAFTSFSLPALDVRLAARAIRRYPLLSMLTVVAMALGIGSTAGAFALIRGAFFSELPFPGGDRIYVIEDYNVTRGHALQVDASEYERRRDGLTSFEEIGAYHSRSVVIAESQRVNARYVTPEILRLTATVPLMGRIPDERDAGAGSDPGIVLPHGLWATLLGADPTAIGKTIRVAGVERTIIGVMPEGFGFPFGDEVWIPMDVRSATEPLYLIGKLREGVDVAAARAELAVIARVNEARLNSTEDVVRHLVTKLSRPITGDAQLLVLAAPLGALILLLVVMATNVATVVMARNAARTNELAVRAALGGSRGRLVGQLVLEVAITVVVAAVIGLSAARYGLTVLEARVTGLPFWVDFSLDPRVIAFTALLTGLATSVAGLGPALRATSGDVHDILKDGGRSGSALRFGRMTDAIVIVELAVSVGFLAAAAILAESLLSFSFARYELPGNETLVANLYFGQPAEFSDPDVQLGDGERQRIWREFTGHARQSQQEILDGALGLPGVDAVTIASRFPGDESVRSRVEIEHATSSDPVMAEIAHVGEGYFDLLGVGITRGRDFLATEREGSFVAIVDEPFVQKHLHGASALGRRFRLVRDEGEPGAWLEIVGVIPDIGLAVGDPSRSGSVYRPIEATNIFWLAMRGDGEPERWIPALTEMVREVDETVRVQGPQSLERLMMLPVLLYRGIGFGFLILGGVALLLSAVSLHAITACSVARRTRELGIRRALGAGTANMVSATVRRAAVQMGAGLLLGSGIGFGLLSLASILPWRLGAGHSLFIALVPAVLALSILVALWRPLSHALAIRPADALRYE